MKVKRYPVIIVIALFSVILWVTVNMGYEYQATIDVPVDPRNIPEGKALRPPVQRSISFQAHGTGWRLAGLSFSPDMRFVVDLAGGKNQTVIDINREFGMHLRRPTGLQLRDAQPDTLFLVLEQYVEKVVPVRPVLDIDFHRGYAQVGEMELQPDEVRIGGAKSFIDKLTTWSTKRVRYTDVKSDLAVNVPLSDTLGSDVSKSTTTVTVEIKVQPFAEKRFPGIPVEVVAAPSNREVILIPPKLDIVARGGLYQLTNIGTENFRATVNYRVILLDTTGTVQPEIAGPEGIEIIVQKPERFQYIIRRRL